MVLKIRQPNRRRFKSAIRESRKRQREYLYAAVSVLVVKIILFVFLCILFSVTIKLFHYRFEDGGFVVRNSVPALVAAFAAILAFYIYKNIKEIRALSKENSSSRE